MRRLSSSGPRAYIAWGMYNLPTARMEQVFPAMTGGFLTTGPSGKSKGLFFRLGLS